MDLPSSTSSSTPWRVLEFYSGIGGMRYSLMQAGGFAAVVVEAFEINDVANDVYQFNFSHRPYQGNIHSLTPSELDKYRADAWLLSPPCQPYTRQGLRKGSADARASSFVKLLQIIPSMKHPPLAMLIENVVGFETSDTHRQLMEFLDSNNYNSQEFILSPVQFGIPYSRPRYFCLAKRKPLSFINSPFIDLLLCEPQPPTVTNESVTSTYQISHSNIRWEESSCSPIQNFLQSSCSLINNKENAEFNLPKQLKDHTKEHHADLKDANLAGAHSSEVVRDGSVPSGCLPHFANENHVSKSLIEYAVPCDLIERWGKAVDVVFPSSKRCCCFTKSYYRYVKGTGSLLATVQPSEDSEFLSLKELGLRYFTPREVANLHSFPKDFDFPSHVTIKQRYALLGNSLSVAVVGALLRYLFA